MISFILGVCCAAGAIEEQTGNWSEVHEGLKARLHLQHRFAEGHYSEILVYLELCNTCPPEGTVHITFPFSSLSNLSFMVKDLEGNEIVSKPTFGSTVFDPNPFVLTLPQDCTMRFCISLNGGGVYQDRALLYLGIRPPQAWYFMHGETKAYELSATLSVPQSERYEDRHWSGKLTLPPVRIPVPETGQDAHVEDKEKSKN
jgi:hypothetical protein